MHALASLLQNWIVDVEYYWFIKSYFIKISFHIREIFRQKVFFFTCSNYYDRVI